MQLRYYLLNRKVLCHPSAKSNSCSKFTLYTIRDVITLEDGSKFFLLHELRNLTKIVDSEIIDEGFPQEWFSIIPNSYITESENVVNTLIEELGIRISY
jgi:hypothetical protein